MSQVGTDCSPAGLLLEGWQAAPVETLPHGQATVLLKQAPSERQAAEMAAVHLAPARIESRLPERCISPCPPWKRAMDVAGALLGMLLLSPLLLVVAVYVKLVSSGPVFFRQQRYGAGGKPFMMWKFRTIEMDNASERHLSYVSRLMDSHQRLKKCDRELKFIRGGRLLRKLGIDELPQLFNVLKGDMSLVGPRPDVMPVDSYQAWQRRRFDVVPGITGLWQVSGKNNTTFATMMRMDILYVRRRSLRLDVSILLQTIPAVLFG